MKQRSLVTALLAGTLTLSACAASQVSPPPPAQSAPQSASDPSAIDGRYQGGGSLKFNIAQLLPASTKRQVLALAGQVASYTVVVSGAVTLTTTLNNPNDGFSQANFVNLPPGGYTVSVVAKDLNGQVISASQSPVASTVHTVEAYQSLLVPITIQLIDTEVMDATGQLQTDLTAQSGELLPVAAPSAQVGVVSTAGSGFSSLPVVVGSYLDNDTSFTMSQAQGDLFDASTYQAFQDGSTTGTYLGNVEVIHTNADSPNNNGNRSLTLQFNGQSNKKLVLYFDAANKLIGISDFAAAPGTVQYIDPEKTPNNVTFTSQAFPTGTPASQFTWLDDSRRVFELYTSPTSDRLLGLSIPSEALGLTPGTAVRVNFVAPPTGTVLGTFSVGSSPFGIAIDGVGNAWVTNSGSNNVSKLSPSGATLGTFSVGAAPTGIAIDGAGNAWVVNTNSNSVTKLSPAGVSSGTYTIGNGSVSVAVDGPGNVWVASQTGNNVWKLSPTGTLLGIFNVGTIPQGIAIDGAGNAWVANLGSNNVTKLSPAGAHLGTFPVGGGPTAIAIDGAGNAWVANSSSDTVTKLSPTGVTTGPFPVGSSPNGIDIDNAGNAWVVNRTSNNVTKLSSTGVSLGTFNVVGPNAFKIAIDLAGNAWVTNNASTTITKLSH